MKIGRLVRAWISENDRAEFAGEGPELGSVLSVGEPSTPTMSTSDEPGQ